MSKNVDEGELATAYRDAFIIYNPDKIYFKGYFPEKYLSRIRIGQDVAIKLDGSEKEYKAKISYVSERSEFTPKEVQTEEERVKQVFAVKAYFTNVDKYLKPGMPAEMLVEIE